MKKFVFLPLLLITIYTSAQNFGNYYPYWEEAVGDVVIAYDDGYAILGFANSGEMDNYLFVLRTNLNGDTLWSKQIDIGNTGSSLGYISACTQDNMGNLYLAPKYSDSANLIKLSYDFEIVWLRIFAPEIEIKQLLISKDNSLLFTGINSLQEHCLYKSDTAGNIIWQSVALAHFGWQFSLAYSPAILEMDNNNIVMASVLTSIIGTPMCDLYTFTQDGDTISSSPMPWILTDMDTDGNKLIGIAHTESGSVYWEDNLLVNILPDGTLLSEKSLIFHPLRVSLYRFVRNTDNQFVATGAVSSPTMQETQIILHGMSLTGDSLWTNLFLSSRDTWPNDIALSNTPGYVVTGFFKDSNDKIAPFLLKTDSLGNINTLGINKPKNTYQFSVYPNPANKYVVFDLKEDLISNNLIQQIVYITDAYGRLADKIIIAGGKTVWDTSNVTSGVYLYHFYGGTCIKSGKVLILK